MRWRLGVLIGLAALLLGGCGDASFPDRPTAPVHQRTAAYAEQRLTWAQGRTIHYGKQEIPVDGDVQTLWRTPYAFIAEVSDGSDPDAGSRPEYVTASGTTPLPGQPDDVKISPDGRYAGWIDYDGPKRPTGRLARAVVVDLRTGQEVLRNGDQMGGAKDDLADLYEDAEVHFLGFDDDYAYWDTPTGDHQLRRARIGTWTAQAAPVEEGEGAERLRGHPYDALKGRETGMRDDGRGSASGGGPGGFVSPDGRWCVTDGLTGHLRVGDCASGRLATPDYPEKWVFFGGWSDRDTFDVLSLRHYDFAISPPAQDHSTGVIASCSLKTRRCAVVRRVQHTDSVVFATGPSNP